jgi:drug/metabolite transporter (DMT)-like permease
VTAETGPAPPIAPQRGAGPATASPALRPGVAYGGHLGLLAIMWGSSYLFIKIGVETLPPLSLVAGRLGVGAAILVGIAVAARVPFPRDRRVIGHLLVLGIVNITIPFWLIGWAEQRIDSGLAGILNATGPFFTMILAGTFLHDDRITARRLTGLAIGFAGITVISSRDLGDLGSALGVDRLLGELAVVGASLAYAVGNIYVRRFIRDTTPLVAATGQVTFGFVTVSAVALAVDGGIRLPGTPGAVFSIAWLGIVGTACAYIVFFRLLSRWGPTRASLVAYTLPIVAVGLGVAVLGETVDARFLAGAALVVVGIWVVNRRGGAAVAGPPIAG